MVVVADTTPLRHLAAIQKINLQTLNRVSSVERSTVLPNPSVHRVAS